MMNKIPITAILILHFTILFGQKSELSVKGIIVPWLTALHFSVGIEVPLNNDFTTQTTYNFLEIYSPDSDEINRRNALIQEIRYYPLSIKSDSFFNLYFLVFPRIAISKQGFESSETYPVHNEFEYGGGTGVGTKLFSNKRFFVDMNLGVYYRVVKTDYKKEDYDYYGWLPKINLHVCYKILDKKE